MRKSGEITAQALKKALETVKPGVNMLEVERVAEEEIIRLGAQPSFKTVPGYHWTTCLTVNEEVVHGIPRDIVLNEGDCFSIDIGAVYHGWHTDAAWSVIVGKEPNQFLQIGEKALWEGIDQAKNGNKVGDISAAIQKIVEGEGYHIVRSLVGHGVGKELHENPEIPGFGRSGTGPLLKNGMTIAIEVIYTAGTRDVELAADGWTIASADGSIGGLFEMSVVVTDNGPEVLTDWRQH